MEVELIGPIGDPSGYGHDCRQTAHALIRAGVDLSITRMQFDPANFTCDYGRVESLLRHHIKPAKNPKIQIIHSTPEFWSKHVRKDCYTIGKTVWETDRIDERWTKYIQDAGVDELWLPNQFNIDVFKKDLPKLRMTDIPHVHDTEVFNPAVAPLDLEPFGVTDDLFVFGAGFQWTERKNPLGLITAYVAEFNADDPVALVLKTYASNTSDSEVSRVHQLIFDALKDAGFPEGRAKIALISQLLPFDMLLQFHRRVDCGVYPHRGEGWGLHISESMLMGTPCIVTNWSGSTTFCDEGNSYPLNYQMTPVSKMPWCPWYNATQSWAEPDLIHLRKTMRHVFENRKSPELSDKGVAARATIHDRYNLDAVGKLMKTRLEEI